LDFNYRVEELQAITSYVISCLGSSCWSEIQKHWFFDKIKKKFSSMISKKIRIFRFLSKFSDLDAHFRCLKSSRAGLCTRFHSIVHSIPVKSSEELQSYLLYIVLRQLRTFSRHAGGHARAFRRARTDDFSPFVSAPASDWASRHRAWTLFNHNRRVTLLVAPAGRRILWLITMHSFCRNWVDKKE
jgi:hypothetical protein